MTYGVNTIRAMINNFEGLLRNMKGRNKLTDQYRQKICYMLMWMRMIPCNKSNMEGWSMPDYNDLAKLKEKK